jgi:protease-4
VGGLVALGLIGLAVISVALIFVLGASGGVAGGTAPAVYEEEYVSGEGPDKVAVIPVQGTIASADSSLGGIQPTVTPEGLADALGQAADDDRVRAVVLEVNSPGGGVTASDEMHQSIVDFKENTGKPVVVSMGDSAASGGYYISAPADRIVANETTLTGSLGVVLPLLNYSEAGEKYGVTQNYVTSGEFKTIGSPWKDLEPEEREIFQTYVDQSYDEFVRVISSGRGLPEDRVREIADGRIYSGETAKELGLVDSFGGLDEASAEARVLAKAGQATVVRYVQTPTFTDTLLSGLSPQPTEAERLVQESGLNLEAKPYYLYLPGA